MMIQTRKIRNFPIILYGREFWGGMMDWLGDKMLATNKIDERDLRMLHLTDSPAEIVDIIVRSQDSLGKIDRNVDYDY